MSTPSRKLLRAGKPCCGLVAAVLLLMALAVTARAQEESLGDYARRIQNQKQSQVLISTEDGQHLFKEVDTITQFSSQDSGLPKLAPVKRQLIGRAEAEKYFRSRSADEAQQRRIDQTTVVLQKFGMLPASFDLNTAMGDLVLNGIAGFYAFNDKTMYLLNWIAPDEQKMVMAHELTHALQDQNFNLTRFVLRAQMEQAPPQMKMQQDDNSSESSLARRAVMEGQATVVGLDYRVKGLGINLADSPDARQIAENTLQASYDPPVIIHNAPRLLRETMIFPYREGLQFELELLAHGGRQEAFRETFKHPPLNTHQILQPEAYLKNEPAPLVKIGDLAPVFGAAYQACDSGTVGELDVQIMSEEFGRENDIYTVARKWDGGSYVAVRRSALAADAKLQTSDVALVYLSRWKTQQAAERFGHIYLQGIAKRLSMSTPDEQNCAETKCAGPLWEEHALTSEGPVHAELWPGNLLLITQSVDDTQMPTLRSILLAGAKVTRTSAVRSNAMPTNATQASAAQPELAPRLFAMPQFQALSEQAGIELGLAIQKRLAH